jgi:hypothetical protein
MCFFEKPLAKTDLFNIIDLRDSLFDFIIIIFLFLFLVSQQESVVWDALLSMKLVAMKGYIYMAKWVSEAPQRHVPEEPQKNIS